VQEYQTRIGGRRNSKLVAMAFIRTSWPCVKGEVVVLSSMLQNRHGFLMYLPELDRHVAMNPAPKGTGVVCIGNMVESVCSGSVLSVSWI
jgi:hypothetical protein